MKKKDKVEEAQKILAEVEQKKREAFAKEYQALCERYGYHIEATLIVAPNKG